MFIKYLENKLLYVSAAASFCSRNATNVPLKLLKINKISPDADIDLPENSYLQKQKCSSNFPFQHHGRRHHTVDHTFCLRYHTVIKGFKIACLLKYVFFQMQLLLVKQMLTHSHFAPLGLLLYVRRYSMR